MGPVAQAQSAVSSFAGQEADARLGADISGLMSAAATANTTVAQLAGLEADVKVTGDTSSLAGAATRAQTFAAQIAALAPTIRVTAQDTATARLQTIQGIAHEVGLLAPEVKVTADVVAADVNLQYINRVLDGIDGRHVNATVDVDVDSARNNLRGFTGDLNDADRKTNDLSGRLRGADSAMRVLATGGIIALGGALGPLGAAALVAGGALSGVATGFGLVAAAAIGTFNDIEFKEGQFVAKEGAVLTQSQQRLVASLNAFAGAYKAAMAPAENAMVTLASSILTRVTPALGAIGNTANLAVLAVGRAFDTLMTSFTVPAQLAIFQNFLAGIPGLVETATRAAGTLALALFDIFAVPVTSGLAQQLFNYIDDLATRFLTWVQSAEGQNAIAMFFQQAADIAGPLATAVGQIATGIGDLVQSGVAAELAGNIATLLGTIGDNLPVLIPFVFAINELLTAFNNLPQPIKDTITEIVLINSVLGFLGFGSIFSLAGAVVQLAVASTLLRAAGLPSVLGLIGSGIGSIAGVISTFISTAIFYLQYFFVVTLPEFAALALEFFTVTIPGAVGAGLGPIALVLGTLLASWYYILGPAGLIVGVLVGFAAFIAGGWVVLVVAAIASAVLAIGVALYRNWDTIKVAIDTLVGWFRDLPGWLQAAFISTISALNPAFAIQAAIMTAYNWLTSTGAPTLTSWFSSLPGWLWTALTTSLNATSIFEGIYNAVWSLGEWLGTGGFDSIVTWFQNLPSNIASALANGLASVLIFAGIYDTFTDMVSYLQGGGDPWVIVSWFTTLPGRMVSGIIEGLSTNPLFGPVFDSVSNFFSWVKDLRNSLIQLGESLLLGFIAGVQAKAKSFIDAVVAPVKTALDYVWDLINPGSPSKTGRAMTVNLAEGWIAGLREMLPAVRTAAGDVFGALGDTIESPSLAAPGMPSASGSSGNLPAAVSSSLARRGRKRRKQQPIIIQNHVLLDGKEMAKWVNATTHEAFRNSQLRGDYLGGGL